MGGGRLREGVAHGGATVNLDTYRKDKSLKRILSL